MIVGRFQDHFPRVSLELPTLNGRYVSVEFILDTGFDGDISLPSAFLRRFDSSPAFSTMRELADGSYREFAMHSMTIQWNGEEREIEVLVLEREPLLGTMLPDGGRITIDLVEGG